MRPVRALFLLAALLIALAPTPSEAARKRIRLGTIAPSGTTFHKILEEMVAEWSKGTEGRLKAKIIAGGVAGDEPAMVRQMKFGKLGSCVLLVAGLSTIEKGFDVFAMPLTYENREELEYVITKMQPHFREKLRKKGFELVNLGFIGWAHMFSKEPVTSVADVKKRKLFTCTEC